MMLARNRAVLVQADPLLETYRGRILEPTKGDNHDNTDDRHDDDYHDADGRDESEDLDHMLRPTLDGE